MISARAAGAAQSLRVFQSRVFSRGGPIKYKRIFILLLIASGGSAYYYLVYLPAHRAVEVAYVVPPSIVVVDSTAEVRLPVGTLKNGDRVEVLARAPNWARVRLANRRSGWVESKDLLDSEIYESNRRLLKELESIPAQAVGHTSYAANLRVEPSRDAPPIAQLPEKQGVEIFGRRLAERPTPADQTPPNAPLREAWYLVRADSQAGWVMGRLVALDVPEGISIYAQNVNLVAWLVLSTVEDGGRQVPQYLVADRLGAQEFDFNHIRVFTWWAKKHRYATAYVESNLRAYFPIQIRRVNEIPYFRLRLVDRTGRKFQKIYGMHDTIVRLVGTVDGWESQAMPWQSVSRGGRARGPGERRQQRGLGVRERELPPS